MGVDFDPHAVKRWNSKGRTAVFGDAEDPEFPSTLPLSSARWAVSSTRDRDINLALMHSLRGHGYTGGIAVTASNNRDAEAMRKAGANLVFVPYTDAASQAVELLVLADQREERRKMDALISSLKNHYIICGYGRMGKQIAADFQRNRVPFVIVEHNPEQVPKLAEANIPHIVGMATQDDVLVQAGIQRASGLISVTATDEENVFIVLTARGLNPGLYIVARSIRQENEGKLRKAGADRVLSPYVYGGRRIAAAILRPLAIDFLDLIESDEFDLEVEDFIVSAASPLADKTICQIKDTAGVTVLAVRRDGEVYPNPNLQLTVQAGDEIIAMGSSAQLEEAEKLAGGM
jgi:voltage-gated potassium channel